MKIVLNYYQIITQRARQTKFKHPANCPLKVEWRESLRNLRDPKIKALWISLESWRRWLERQKEPTRRADRGRAREDYQKGTGWNDQRGPERTKEDQGRTPAIRVCTSRWNRSSLKIEVSIRVSWIQVVSRLKHFNFLLHLTKREQTANETK